MPSITENGLSPRRLSWFSLMCSHFNASCSVTHLRTSIFCQGGADQETKPVSCLRFLCSSAGSWKAVSLLGVSRLRIWSICTSPQADWRFHSQQFASDKMSLDVPWTLWFWRSPFITMWRHSVLCGKWVLSASESSVTFPNGTWASLFKSSIPVKVPPPVLQAYRQWTWLWFVVFGKFWGAFRTPILISSEISSWHPTGLPSFG